MTTTPPTTLAYAIQLADKLARITSAPAYVVSDQGHLMLASAPDIGPAATHYWQPDQIVYCAGAVVSAPLDVDFAPVGF